MGDTKPTSHPSEIKQPDFARYVGVTGRTLFNCRQEGMPHRVQGKEVWYPVPAALDWFYARKYRPDEDDQDGELPKYADSERRKAAADAEISEMRRDQMRGKLITDEEAIAENQAFVETIMSSLRAAPTRHAAEVLNLTAMPPAIAALQNVMEKAIEDARSALTASAETPPEEGKAA